MSLKQKHGRLGRWTEAGMLVALLTAALFLRLVRLDAVPPGMTHDEAAFGAEAEQILAGDRPVYFALGYGHEPLYAYAVALAFRLLGHTLAAMRVASAVCGLLAVLLTYVIARRLFGRGGLWETVPWLATAGMAVAFWPVSLSRQALRAVTLLVTWMPAAWLFWKGVGGYGDQEVDSDARRPGRSPRWFLPFVLGGVFLGLSFYSYMASRVTWLVFPLWALALLLRKQTRRLLRRIWPGLLVFLLVAALAALPLARYLATHPEAERRVGDMMGPIRELLRGRPQRVLRHAWNALRVFSWEGDRFWAYNIPGRPIFGWIGSALFYLGLAMALWRWADPRFAFLVLWLGVGMAPAMVTTNEGIFLRAIVAQPATYLLLAVGVRTVGQGLESVGRWLRVPGRWAVATTVLLALSTAGLETARTVHAYLYDWPSRPQTRTIYNHNLVALSRYLDASDGGAMPTGVSALYPLYYHDPWIYRYVVGSDAVARGEHAVRWFDGRGCIVYPGTSGSARYAFSTATRLHPALEEAFVEQASLIERIELAADDENPSFELWHWQGGPALDATLERLWQASPMWVSPEVHFDQPDLRRLLDESPRFGDVVALVGYHLEVSGRPATSAFVENRVPAQAGAEVQLVTYWRALRTVEAEDDWSTFLHLLDAQSAVIGGVDVLHCPPTGWVPGDIAVQVHRFRIAGDAPPGEAALEIGVYRRGPGRLPVWVGDQVTGDRVLLKTLRID